MLYTVFFVQAGSQRRIENFGEDIKDSEIYTDLIAQIAPKQAGVNKTAMQRQVNYSTYYIFQR
jgi:hypothetical protein